jgi:hypothetical protein
VPRNKSIFIGCQQIFVSLLLLQTFGNFQQRPDVRYGGYAAGRGNYWASYNFGRGYGYGGRGRGGNTPF